MAILGIQVVISFAVALFLQKLSPYYSLARWIICNGLYRYLYPTNETLKMLAGKTAAKPLKGKRNIESRKHQANNGQSNKKPAIEAFTIPCNLEITLQKTKVREIDLFALHRYQDFRWLIDISLSAFIVYTCVEIAVFWRSDIRAQEFNLSLVWCLIVVSFAMKELAVLTAIYWRGDQTGERSMCISFGMFFLILSMGILVVDESVLEFGIEKGYRSFMDNLTSSLKELDFTTGDPPPLWSFKIVLVCCSGLIGAMIGFPGLRFANMYRDGLADHEGKLYMQILLHASFVSPLIPILAWIRPLANAVVAQAQESTKSLGSEIIFTLTEENFPKVRIMTVLVVCIFRMALTRTALQTYLNMAYENIKKLRKETGKISNIDLQNKVARIFLYLTPVALQYLAPMILLLFMSLSWLSIDAASGIPVAPVVYNNTSNSTLLLAGTKYVMILRKAFQCGDLLQGLTSYFIWWTLLTWLSTSVFGVCYLRAFGKES